MVILSPRAIPEEGQGLVPNVVGMGLKDALYLLENRGLHVRISGTGMVRRQSIMPGSRLVEGASITIELA